MAQGDLYQVIDYQSYLGEDILNIYYYRQTTIDVVDTNDLLAWVDVFKTTVVDKVKAAQSSQLTHVKIEARNLTDNLTFATRVLSGVVGTRTATEAASLPSYVTIGFQLLRESLATRNGYKRFSGVVEGDAIGNVYTVPTTTIRTDIETALAADISSAFPTTMEPVIVRRPISAPVAIPYTYSSIGSAILRGLGTQNTRKPATPSFS